MHITNEIGNVLHETKHYIYIHCCFGPSSPSKQYQLPGIVTFSRKAVNKQNRILV